MSSHAILCLSSDFLQSDTLVLRSILYIHEILLIGFQFNVISIVVSYGTSPAKESQQKASFPDIECVLSLSMLLELSIPKQSCDSLLDCTDR